MRRILVQWMVQAHLQFRLVDATLFLAVHVLDRISSLVIIHKSEYQLYGAVSLLIAAKYEENHGKVPSIKDLSFCCSNIYSPKEFKQKEMFVLSTLGFDIGYPTAEYYANFIFQSQNPCEFQKQICRYLMELSLTHSHFLTYSSGVVATSAYLLSLWFINPETSFPYNIIQTCCMAMLQVCQEHRYESGIQTDNVVFLKYKELSGSISTWVELELLKRSTPPPPQRQQRFAEPITPPKESTSCFPRSFHNSKPHIQQRHYNHFVSP